MIMKPVALECVLGGPCKFKTVKLEFAQAFQLLELHMKYVHTPIVSNEEVNTSKHDDDLEDSYEIEELIGEKETSSNDEVDDNYAAPVEKLQSDFADVTSVRDDQNSGSQSLKTRNHNLHPVDVHQTNFADVTLVRDDRDPVKNHEACTSCGRKTHSSHRTSRRKFCSAWNKFCRL